MNKLLILSAILAIGISGCKDEINLPEYGGYVDGDSPIIVPLSPAKDASIDATQQVNFEINITDDYQLAKISVRLIPDDISLTGFDEEIILNDSVSSYTFTKDFTLPTADSMRYEVNVRAEDLVGNSLNEVYFFTAK
jgi:hypothetical protein